MTDTGSGRGNGYYYLESGVWSQESERSSDTRRLVSLQTPDSRHLTPALPSTQPFTLPQPLPSREGSFPEVRRPTSELLAFSFSLEPLAP